MRLKLSLAFLLSLIFLPIVHASGQATPLKLSYHLAMSNPASHLFEVTITAADVTTNTLDFSMPAWSPGRYVIYDFAKNVQEFSARDAQDRPLRAPKIDKQTWRVETQGSSVVRVSYKLFANSHNGTFTQLNSHHGNYNGASLYMYVVGHKETPITLTIAPPAGWQIINGFSRDPTQQKFHAANYDILIDMPTEISREFELHNFTVEGKTYRVMIHNIGQPGKPATIKRFLADLEKIVRAQTAIMGVPEFEHYTFLFHFIANNPAGGDGMEHLNSTQVTEAFELAALDYNYYDPLGTASHEFFHLWNVKRLRPVALGPWDYARETYTDSLWIAEGMTSYYGDLTAARAGVLSRPQYYAALSREITTLQNMPGRLHRSAEQASFDTWLFLAVPDGPMANNLSNTTISYYNKGELLGLLFDLEIRGRTNNAKSLDDVFRHLYDQFYLKSPADSYYLKGRGFRNSDFLAAVNQISGSDFSDFYRRYVSGVEELNYVRALAYAGLKLEVQETGPPEATVNKLYRVVEDPQATPAQLRLREAWLNGK